MRQHDSERPAARPPFPSASISDRPTFVHDDYVEPRLESPPSVTVEEVASDETLEPASPLETPVRFTPPMPSPQFAAPSAPHAATVRQRARRKHTRFAPLLFVLFFVAVGLLLDYACRPELALALGHLRGGEHATTSVK